jgi:alanine dehydrogenase
MSDFLHGITPQEQAGNILLSNKCRSVGLLKDTVPLKGYVCLAPCRIATIKKEDIDIWIERSFGAHAGFTDLDYADAGGDILENAISVIRTSHIIMKLESLSLRELSFLKPNQIVVSSLDMMQISREYLTVLKEKNITAFAIDFVEDLDGNSILSDIFYREENKTSVITALSNFLYPILITLATSSNLRSTIQTNPALFQSLYCYQGAVTRRDISEKTGFPRTDFLSLFWN